MDNYEQNEVEKIQQEYARRNALENKEYNLFYTPSAHLIKFRRGYEISKMLNKCFPEGLREKKILDVGCGTGGFLHELRNMGALANNLNGIDLSDERILSAKQLYPEMHFTLGSGNLPFNERSFDLVSAFTVFSSILDDEFREKLASEILSVTKDNGNILIYDFIFNNPNNKNVRGFTAKQVKNLFPNCMIKSVSLTLAPPISRFVSRYSITIAYILEKIFPILRTHKLYLIQKNTNR